MSMQPAEREHLEDDDIVRIMDEEGTPDELRGAEAHLQACESCRQRASAMGASSAWFSASLPLLDPPPLDDLTRARALERIRAAKAGAHAASRQGPRKDGRYAGAGGGRRRRLIAAGIGVLLLAGLTVEPLRAWLLDGLRELAGTPDRTSEVAHLEPPAPGRSAVSVRFTAAGPLFRIDVAQPQDEGSLTLRRIAAGEASAEVVGGAGETLLIMPSGLRVGNEVGSTASYVVELPGDGVRTVEIRVGGRIVDTHSLSSVTGELNLSLAPEDASP